MKTTQANTVNPFHPDYVSQIKPFRSEEFKKPDMRQPLRNPHARIATEPEGKYYRMLKANI